MSKNKNKSKNEEREINLEESTPVIENPESTPPPNPAASEAPKEETPHDRYVHALRKNVPFTPVTQEFPLLAYAQKALSDAGCVNVLDGVHLKSSLTRHATRARPKAGDLVFLTMGPPESDEVVIFLDGDAPNSEVSERLWQVIRVVGGVAEATTLRLSHRTLEDGRSVIGWFEVHARNVEKVQE